MARKNLGRKRMSPKLDFTKQRKIGKYREDNPHIPVSTIANKFNCTLTQANYAIGKYNRGELKEVSLEHSRKESTRLKKIKHEVKTGLKDVNQIFEEQRAFVLQQLDATDNKISASERMDILIKWQKSGIQSHLRSVDAELIVFLIQHLKPGTSETEAIFILNEVKERWKNIQQ